MHADVLSENDHTWVGVDVSGSMLEVAVDREVEGDLFLNDIGQGFGFRAGVFDGAVRLVDLVYHICALCFCHCQVMQT
jgi:18S rRNA (guanine1575-N7)-methyltransferase